MDTFPEYKYSDSFTVTEDIRAAYDEEGFIIVRNLLNNEEIKKLKHSLEDDNGITKYAYELGDEKKPTKMCLWNHPGSDVTGMISRCEKVVSTSEMLLGGEVYHYHAKLMMKDAETGGPHLWHQDYGYWYPYGNLFPDMLTVFIPVDECKMSNGCLQIVPKSHKCGRIDHKMIDGQTGADPERVDQVREVLKNTYVEMEPGDALFFHCNLLHKSDANSSAVRRWALLIAYNKATNNPVYKHICPQYTPLNKVPNSAILECSNYADLSDKDFLLPNLADYQGIKVVKRQ